MQGAPRHIAGGLEAVSPDFRVVRESSGCKDPPFRTFEQRLSPGSCLVCRKLIEPGKPVPKMRTGFLLSPEVDPLHRQKCVKHYLITGINRLNLSGAGLILAVPRAGGELSRLRGAHPKGTGLDSEHRHPSWKAAAGQF